MRLEDQVISLDLAKRLKKLGVKQDAYQAWVENRPDHSFHLWNEEMRAMRGSDLGVDRRRKVPEEYSAFSVAELGEMLHPFNLIIDTISHSPDREPHDWCVALVAKIEHIEASSKKHKAGIYEIYHLDHVEIEPNEAEARGKMVEFVIRNKLMRV